MKIRQVSLQVPVVSIEFSSYIEKIESFFGNLKEKLKNKYSSLLFSVLSFIRRKSDANQVGVNYQAERKFKLPFTNNKKFFRKLLIIIVVPLLFIAVGKLYISVSNNKSSDNRVEVKGAISAIDINKEFGFPLKNSNGEEVSRIKYLVEKAELRDEIITEGKRATAVKGRIFLVLTLKITNQYEKPIEINTRDYVRLSVNGKEDELLAPETHNDPVEIQAISTKYTRVGFIINDSDKDYVLHIGEILGEKQKVGLDLK